MKKILLGIMIGILLCSGIGYAATLYNATDVLYESTDTSWEVDNVNDALNSLNGALNDLQESQQNNAKKALVFTSSPVDMTQYTDRWSELTTADFKAVFTKASVSFKAHAPDGQTDHDSSVSASVTPAFSYDSSTGQLTFSNKSAATNHTSGGSYVKVSGTLSSTANVIWLGTIDGQ